jgi:hypothetical protein
MAQSIKANYCGYWSMKDDDPELAKSISMQSRKRWM